MTRIATVTLAPALDHSLVVDRMVANGKIRTAPPETQAGGGGINVGRAVHQLGGTALVLWMSGGATGRHIAQLLEAGGVEHEPFSIAAETRLNIHIRERSTGRAFRLDAPGARVTEAEAAPLLARVAALDVDYLVLSGSLPPGLPSDYYARLAGRVRPGVRVILDTTGDALSAGLAGNVFLAKPDRFELAMLAGHDVDEQAERVEAARSLIRAHRVEIVATELGHDEGLLVVTQATVEPMPVPGIEAVSAVGAGDSTVAGIVLGLARGMKLSDATRFGAAAGAAAALTPGTELCRREDAERLYAEISMSRHPPEEDASGS